MSRTMPSVSRSANTTTVPRPSISPLSTASRNPKSSPIATRDASMRDTVADEHEEAIETSEPSDAEIGEHDDAGSSSLSEPEDDNDDAEDEDNANEDALNGYDSPAQQLLDNDSEAETERLDPTPQKARKHADSVGRTPSKLSQAATAEDEELSEPPSPLAAGAGAASSTSTVATAGQKRKRSETADSSLTSAESDLAESPRKKTHSLDAIEDPLELGEQSIEHADGTEETPAVEDAQEQATTARKITKGKKGGRPPKKHKEPVEDAENHANEHTFEAEEPTEEKEAKTEEEIKAKKEASSAYDEVQKHFRSFREKLNSEQLAALTSELSLLSASNCLHPEYLKQVACVDARLQKQKTEAQAFLNYRMRSIRERTLGDRSQIQSQYFQSVRELREDVLYKLGEDWYAIQKERRQSHQEKDDVHLYLFQTDKKLQKRNQAKYNQEVSVLSGMAKWVGFPAAPTINGVEGDTFEEDMKAMRMSKRIHQSAAPPRPAYYAAPAVATIEQNQRLDQERFFEQNPWARPQAPIHTHATPGISHTPDWAEQPSAASHSSAKQLIRNLSGHIHRTASPYATPLTQKRPPEHLSSAGTLPMNSDGVEPPSSVLAAPPTSSRIELMHHQPHSNHTSPATYHKPRPNGHELTGFRNISGISGVSTIDTPPEKPDLPHLVHVPSASHTVFDTSQLHRHSREEREVYPNVGFRPQEGAFGTPAPLTGPHRDSRT